MAPTEADLWKTFAIKLISSVMVGQTIGPGNRVYIPLLNSTTIPAGTRVPTAATNFGAYKTGDALINANNPQFTQSTDGFAQRCLQYLRAVWLASDSSSGTKAVLDLKYDAMMKADDAFYVLEDKMRDRFQKYGKDSGQTFIDWANANSGAYSAAKALREAAAADYENVLVQVMGVGAQDWIELKKKLESAIGQDKSIYNMPATSAQLAAGAGDAEAPYRVPKYAIDSDYSSTIDNWIATQADKGVVTGRNVVISFDSSEGGNYNWEQLGHDSTKVQGSAGFLPFFSVEYEYQGSKTTKKVEAHEFKTSVGFEMKANGLKSFGIKPDPSWNPGNVQKKFPSVKEGTPAALSEPMVLVTNLVVGWKVEFKISLGREIYDKVTSLIEEAKSHDAGARATLFGFRINVGGSGSYKEENSTNWSDVKTSGGNYEMVIPASTDNVPVLLAVFGTVLSKDS